MSDAGQRSAGESAASQIPAAVQAAPPIGVPAVGQAEVASTGAARLEEHHADFAEFQEAYVRHYIGLADTKAAWSFTIASGVLAYLVGQAEVRAALLAPECSIKFMLLVGSVISLVLSAFFAFRVVAPRLTSQSGEGVVFFGAVAAKASAEAYIRDVVSRSHAELTSARLQHCYDVSKICTKKYGSLKKSIWFGVPALSLTFLYLLF